MEDSAEITLRQTQQSLKENTNSTLSADAMQSESQPPALLKVLEAQNHLRLARNKMILDESNKKVIVPPHIPFKRPGNIGQHERRFEPRADPKEQLMGVVYADEKWDPRSLLEETDQQVVPMDIDPPSFYLMPDTEAEDNGSRNDGHGTPASRQSTDQTFDGVGSLADEM